MAGKEGKKQRKYGHNKTRSISMAGYRATGRMFSNKRKAIEREAALQSLRKQVRSETPLLVEALGMQRAVKFLKQTGVINSKGKVDLSIIRNFNGE